MPQIPVTQAGVFSGADITAINRNFSQLFAAVPGAVGNIYYVNAVTGSDTSGTGSSSNPYATLAVAYAACVTGHNDVVIIIGNGTTAATARVDTAFVWSKDATHLFGFCSPTLYSQRARIAPTGATTAFANFFTVSGNGCLFQNIQWFHGFNTGTTAEICMTITGSRNVFLRCHIAGMGDAASAADAGSRSLKIGSAGSGENVFEDCVIGLDTVTRSAANASLELAGATPRNVFRRCEFPFMTSSATVLGILGTGADCLDRFNLFEQCTFMNAIKSSSTQMTVLASLTNAAPGGMLLFRQCSMIGATKFGDTLALANSYLDMAAVSGSAGGLMVAPS